MASLLPSRQTTGVRHALHVAVLGLLVIGVVRTWQTLDAHRSLVATGIAVVFAAIYLIGVARRGGGWARSVTISWVTALVACWVAGSVITEGFSWVAFPLFFLVLSVIPGWWGLAAVGSMVAWSVVTAVVRVRLAGAPGALPVGTWLGPALGALSAVGAYALFRQLRADAEQHRALVAELRAAQAELAATERTNGMLAERARLAREIHDTIAQGLGSIVLMARTAQMDDDPSSRLSSIEDTARANLAEARRFVRDLADPTPDLIGSLEAVAADARSRATAIGAPLEVEVRCDADVGTVAPAIVEALHRAVQASVANVIAHARAAHCVISVTPWSDRVSVDVVDDGVGFDTATPVGAESFGLRGVRDRLALVGGTVELSSAPGEGCTVALTVPREVSHE